MKETVTIGEPAGIKITIDAESIVKVWTKQTSEDFEKLLLEQIQHTDINVCLSGGLDSQYMLYLTSKLNKKINCYTYRLLWDNSILNASDVYTAQEFAKQFDCEHILVDINAKEFFEKNMHLSYGKEFLNESPQFAIHLYFIDLLIKDYNVKELILGGDPILMEHDPLYNPIERVSSSKVRSVVSTNHMSSLNRSQTLVPYHLFCKDRKIDLLKNIFYMSPEIVFCGYKHNLDTVKEYKQHIERHNDKIKSKYCFDTYQYKYNYYSLLFDNLIPQWGGTTGFEQIKKLLASQTGNYNEFDLLYREPMKKMLLGQWKYHNEKIYGDVKPIIDDFYSTVSESNSQPCNRYKFDF